MILLTGDVHHNSDPYAEGAFQQYTSGEGARKYCDIARKFGIETTLYVTGKMALEQPQVVRELFRRTDVEIGAHTHNMLRMNRIQRFRARLARSRYGDFKMQKSDVFACRAAIESVTGIAPLAWRTHSYASDWRTTKIIIEAGFTSISDQVCNIQASPYKITSQLTAVPINVMPDHEHLIHGHRNMKRIAGNGWEGDCFGNQSYHANEWLEKVVKQVTRIEERQGVACLLVHPQCMDVLDDFKTFTDLCKRLAHLGSETVTNAITKIPCGVE